MNDIRAQEIMRSLRDVYNSLTYFSDTRNSLWEEQAFFKDYVRSGMTVLDAGCGNGRLLELFDGKKIAYVGMDNSAKLLEKAQQYAHKFPNVSSRFFEGSILSVPLPDSSVDILFCIATLHHIPSRTLQIKAAKEFSRVLKPGGILCMTNWYLSAQTKYSTMQIRQRIMHPRMYAGFSYRDFLIPWHMKDKTFYRFYYAFSPLELKRVLHEAGFLQVDNSVSFGARDWSGMKTKRNIITVARSARG
jgi:ubiquinone/menaquinone biosynthesis C-methylase UbiE